MFVVRFDARTRLAPGRQRMLTAEQLREVLDYDPETGVFTHRHTHHRVRAGQAAGTPHSKGYRQVNVGGGVYLAHRLAWLYTYGAWPTHDLDHRNEIKDDNRISNLREATDGLNKQNRSRPQRNNTSGFLGVAKSRGRWLASIGVGGHLRFLGRYDTPEEAAEVYLAAKRELHSFWDEKAS